jgi:hypothetical protein
MARTPIAVTGVTKLGVAAPQNEAADPVNGNSVANSDGQTVLIAGNTGSVDRSLTIRVTATVDGQPVNSRTVTVPAGRRLLLGTYPYWWYGTTLQLDPETSDIRLCALRAGESIPVSPPPGPFSVSGVVVVANLDAAGLSASGSVLIVDTTVTASTIDGNVLVVTV